MINSNKLTEDILAYLQETVPSAIADANTADATLLLPSVAQWSCNYGDVLDGSQNDPAILVINRGRAPSDTFSMSFDFLVGAVVKNTDIAALSKQGAMLEDILSDVLHRDCHLGSSCLDSKILQVSNDIIDTNYIIVIQLEVTMNV